MLLNYLNHALLMVEEAFVTSVVGSFPRPRWLVEAFELFNEGKMDKEEYEEYVNDAVKLTVKEEELAGVEVLTDGEQRRTSFVAFVGQKIPGFKVMHISEINPQGIDIMRRYKAQLTYYRPVAVGPIEDKPFTVDEASFTLSITDRRVKVTIPSPYLIMWEAWHIKYSKDYYKEPEELAQQYSRLVRNEVIRLRDLGVHFIQLDEPMLGDLVEASENEPDRYRKVLQELNGQKYRGFKNELSLARDLINETIKGIDGVRIGMHMDRWPNPDSPYYGVGYEKLAPEVVDIKVKQYVLEYASPGSGDPAKFAQLLPQEKEIGLGVVEVRGNRVEEPSEIVARAERVLKVLDPTRVWLNPDCGFGVGMFRRYSRRIAFMKLRSMAEAAKILRGKYLK
ncbi:Methionine synthase vitamin-B12 independent [Caldivirga maquilingensis IC-167]|uniref:Methionine synthase vitamin-B12 independent n=2 Tax=Caldivirga maquilingensis TaxID=76887 RepID=A8MDF7_CALMQ|nr:Methionine synthase vitamin-B12 independent [Caldivirga maquilingensis IC-167]